MEAGKDIQFTNELSSFLENNLAKRNIVLCKKYTYGYH